MKKLISLIKACMSDNMSLFRIKSKNTNNNASKIVIPIVLFALVFFSIYSYANIIMDELIKYNLEYVLLTLFVAVTAILNLVEGIYKSGGLLFNCKDDNLLLSLPIKKRTVLFIRIFKFYVFELIYNMLFLLPAIVVYMSRVNVNISFYVVSIIMLLLLPIIPIIISCIIGMIISGVSSKFKLKNIVQIVLTTGIMLVIMYFSFNVEGNIAKLAEMGEKLNNVITNIYYPARAYVNLAINFNIKELVLFIIINLSIFTLSIILLSSIYYKINSNIKVVKRTKKSDSTYKIKKRSIMNSLIKKELSKFVATPVFVINAGFGLVLFVAICIITTIKFDSLASSMVNGEGTVSIDFIKSVMPVALFGLIAFTSLMSSITSSMISLEGKSFNILKSLPVKPYTIIVSKVLTAVLIMIPFILVGDIIFFIKFEFNIIPILINLIASFVLPFVAELIGILVNLKYPKMDATNDTEVVKQSMSSGIAVIIGLILSMITMSILVLCVFLKFNVNIVILGGLLIYGIICALLLLYFNKKGVKEFNKINV